MKYTEDEIETALRVQLNECHEIYPEPDVVIAKILMQLKVGRLEADVERAKREAEKVAVEEVLRAKEQEDHFRAQHEADMMSEWRLEGVGLKATELRRDGS